ncbi:MAG: IclR family transcriptional regulator [Proteobacteria bacterium]|nr:IclR family transcriptional regulator [Pseudomonadota bacterium]
MQKRVPRDSDDRKIARKAAATKDRRFVTALARGLDILRVFTPSDQWLANQEIAERTGLPKSTISRLTYTLTELGYLDYSDRLERYRLAPGVIALGYSMLFSLGIRKIARPFMEELAEQANATVSLGRRHRLSAVYIEHAPPTRPLMLPLDIGSWIPIGTTAMGRALLAAMSESERETVLRHLAKEDPARWPQLRRGIERAIEHYRVHGFTMSLGDWQSVVHAVGVPIMSPDGSGLFAFNCGGPSFQLPRDRLMRELGPRLVILARNVEAALVAR